MEGINRHQMVSTHCDDEEKDGLVIDHSIAITKRTRVGGYQVTAFLYKIQVEDEQAEDKKHSLGPLPSRLTR